MEMGICEGEIDWRGLSNDCKMIMWLVMMKIRGEWEGEINDARSDEDENESKRIWLEHGWSFIEVEG